MLFFVVLYVYVNFYIITFIIYSAMTSKARRTMSLSSLMTE